MTVAIAVDLHSMPLCLPQLARALPICSHCHRARASSPAIIFFDEIDGLAKLREASGEGGVGVGERMLAQMLQEMDGLQVRRSQWWWLSNCVWSAES